MIEHLLCILTTLFVTIGYTIYVNNTVSKEIRFYREIYDREIRLLTQEMLNCHCRIEDLSNKALKVPQIKIIEEKDSGRPA